MLVWSREIEDKNNLGHLINYVRFHMVFKGVFRDIFDVNFDGGNYRIPMFCHSVLDVATAIQPGTYLHFELEDLTI